VLLLFVFDALGWDFYTEIGMSISKICRSLLHMPTVTVQKWHLCFSPKCACL